MKRRGLSIIYNFTSTQLTAWHYCAPWWYSRYLTGGMGLQSKSFSSWSASYSYHLQRPRPRFKSFPALSTWRFTTKRVRCKRNRKLRLGQALSYKYSLSSSAFPLPQLGPTCSLESAIEPSKMKSPFQSSTCLIGSKWSGRASSWKMKTMLNGVWEALSPRKQHQSIARLCLA